MRFVIIQFCQFAVFRVIWLFTTETLTAYAKFSLVNFRRGKFRIVSKTKKVTIENRLIILDS